MIETRDDSGKPPLLELPPSKTTRWEAIFLGPQGVRTGWRALLFVAIFIFLFATLQFAAVLLHLPQLQHGGITPAQLALQEFMLTFAVVVATLLLGRVEDRAFALYGMPWRGALRAHFWQGALWGVGQITLLVGLIAARGGYSVAGFALHGGDLLRYALQWAGVFLLVGVFEEFLFRGYLQFTLASQMRFWPAATLLSLGFGAVHLGNPGEGLTGAFSVFVIGMFLCFTLRRTGDLWFAIGWHAAFDFGETYLYAVPNSGTVMQGQMLDASLHGPRWLTGGSVGPEGSVFSFIVVALAFLLFDRLYRAPETTLK